MVIWFWGWLVGSVEDELGHKHGKSEDKDPNCMSEAEGSIVWEWKNKIAGIVENPEIDKTNRT